MTHPLITPTPDDFLAAFDAMPGYRWLALRNAINDRDLTSVGALIVAMLDESATTPPKPCAFSQPPCEARSGGRAYLPAMTQEQELLRIVQLAGRTP